ncbi:MAG TPA: hypothetical protein VHO29_13025 [Marmoricola sp.]|nr:hypothetical protein [Marmoricola sp.]
MSEQTEILEALERRGVLAAFVWAFNSAVERTLDDYSEAAGHGALWLGVTRFTLLCDRLDRVFACERYAVLDGDDESRSRDVLFASLSDLERRSMPDIEPGGLRRNDLNGSPGWSMGDRRFLLASSAFGKVREIPWPRKSPTKQSVARRPSPDPDQRSLWDELAAEEIGGLAAIRDGMAEKDLDTLVLAHSLDPVRQEGELHLGRPQLNEGGGPAWHWCGNLLAMSPNHGGQRTPPAVSQPVADPVPDAPVRLRSRIADGTTDVRGPGA